MNKLKNTALIILLATTLYLGAEKLGKPNELNDALNKVQDMTKTVKDLQKLFETCG